MKKLLIFIAIYLLATVDAGAQSSPGWSYGYVPTPAEWNFWWSKKMDYNGVGPCLLSGCTLTGPLITPASTTIGAGLNLPPGVAPTTPNNGDVWTTTAGIFVQINGVTVGPLASSASGSFTGQQIDTGATTTSPGWYVQITGDTTPRVRIGTNATDIPSIAFGPGNAVRDTFIERVGAGSLRYGAPDAASPVAQSSIVQNVVAGTSNTAGASRIFAGSQGTGSGQGGSIVFQTAPAGSSGTGQNALSAALTIQGSGGLTTGAATDQGAGTLNLAGNLYNNGVAPTGTQGYVRATSPTLVTPALGTPSSVTLTNGTGLPVSTGISGLGTNVATALGVNVGSAGAFVTFNGALGTPSSATLTNATGLPISGGISGLGTGVATAAAIAVNTAGGFATNGNVVTSVTPGSGGLVSSITAACSRGAITTTGTLYVAHCRDVQTGTSYAIPDSDRGWTIFGSNASAQSYTLAQAGAASQFQDGWYTDIQNNSVNVAAVITITPTTSQICAQGTCAASYKLQPGQFARITSDGTNYQVTFNPIAYQLPATPTGITVGAGNLGEIKSATTLQGSAISLTSGTPANIATITLTAGNWLIWAQPAFDGGGTTTVTGIRASISTTSATENAVSPSFVSASYASQTLFATFDWAGSIAPIAVSLSGSQQYWLVERCNFAVSTCSGYGGIAAQRTD